MTAGTRQRILDIAERRVLAGGFTATTIDAVLDEVGVSKGAFFHHFPTKAALGTALVERYAAADLALLDELISRAEAQTDDPAGQVVQLLAAYEQLVTEIRDTQPGCLFVSFVFEVIPGGDEIRAIIARTVSAWQQRILAKLEAAAAAHPPSVAVDLPSLADHVFAVFEGGFVLVRATGNEDGVRAQLAHLRTYFELLFGVTAQR